MKIACPQVDKAATIREMIEFTYLDTEIIDVPWDSAKERDYCRTYVISGDETGHTEASFDDTESVESAIEVLVTLSRKESCPDWVKNLPRSLRGIYEDQKQRRENNLPSPPSLGTSHLRDVVVQMHNREGAIIKYLY